MMQSKTTSRLFIPIAFALASMSAFADKDSKKDKVPAISNNTRIEVIRLLNAEFVWTRKALPMGEKGISIKPNGEIDPGEAELKRLVAIKGQAAKPGERVQITNVLFKGNSIVLEINGGAKKQSHWYQHIQVGVGGTMAQAPQPDERAKGTYLALEFKDYIPEVTLAELKERMAPVFDFSVKSSAQAYVDTLPENVRKAIGEHRVLVGMNKEMVNSTLGRPPQRIRDKDEQNRSYEEWVFGEPPQDVQFIRFVGDEVVQVKIMKIDGEKIVRTEREVKLEDPAVATAPPKEAPLPKPANAPTLRRPGEELPAGDPNSIQTRTPTQMPKDPQPPKSFVGLEHAN
jgi:hypothetical protein